MDATSAPRRQRGFTVIELMIGAVVMLLLAATALPQIFDARARHRVASAAETLAGDLQKARWAAIDRGQPVYVTFGGQGESRCYAIATRPDCPCDGKADACVLKAARPQGLQWEVAQESFAFDPRLGGTSPGTVASFSLGRYAVRVDAEAVGHADVCASGAAMAGVKAC